MREQADHLLIQGNFIPPQKGRNLKQFARVFAVLFFLLIVVALGVYGIKVHYEDGINKLAKDTRALNEQNKELQVRLNHIRSYKNVEAAATQVPHLHMPPTVLDVPLSPQYKLPAMPQDVREFPRVYGY